MTDTRCRLAVHRYGDIVFHDSYATPDKGGSVKPGPSFTMSGKGVLSLLPAAPGTLGGIKVGTTLSIAKDGTLDIQLDTETFHEASPRPASSAATAAWIRGKNFVSQSDLQGKGFVSEICVKELLDGYQPRMGIDDLLPVTQEQFEALPSRSSKTLYIIY
ncbi:hypothetical protein ABFY27_10345 [Akkermansia massiliensis]